MKLTIERDILTTALSRVTPLISKSTIPILGCVRIDANGGIFAVTGQNGMARATQQAVVSGGVEETGSICVQADKFAALVNSLPKGSQIELASTERKLTVRYGRGHASFWLDDPASFPVQSFTAQSEPIKIDVAELRRLLAMTLPFSMELPGRDYLRGVYLTTNEAALTAVATNGHGLALGHSAFTGSLAPMIVPRDACSALIRVLGSATGEAEIAGAKNGFSVTVGGYSFVTRLVDGPYPDYQRVIPASVEKPIMIESGALAEVAGRAQAVTEAADATKAKPRSIHLIAEGSELRIQAGSEDGQTIDETIEIESQENSVEIRLGTAYVLDMIAALGEGLLALHITGALEPVKVMRDGNDAECVVIMPRRM